MQSFFVVTIKKKERVLDRSTRTRLSTSTTFEFQTSHVLRLAFKPCLLLASEGGGSGNNIGVLWDEFD